ncbi:MAG TPA: zf-HC2 domain-containing protein [Pseudonocardiaceae bacterium]|nr:zf-HC2 domain-containing protein [Pseudonocardiaceae bacterium]
MTCPYTIDVAAYVLDALEPAEAERLRDHVADCPSCRPAYEELRGLPTVLHRLTPADAEEVLTPVDLPDTLCDALLAKAAARQNRRVRRRVLGLAAAVVAVLAGAATGIASPHPATTTVAATDPHTWVHASITLTDQTWGTQIRLRLSGVAWAQQCMLVVTSADGKRDVAASWVATYKGSADVAGTTAIPESRISHLDVTTTTGRRLVSVPLPGQTEGH